MLFCRWRLRKFYAFFSKGTEKIFFVCFSCFVVVVVVSFFLFFFFHLKFKDLWFCVIYF